MTQSDSSPLLLPGQPSPEPAPAVLRVLAQGGYEIRNVLRNGEQLLVSLILPLLVLIGLHRIDLVVGSIDLSIGVITPGVLVLAVMAAAFTGQGIATGFERQYGVLAFLSTTPLGSGGLIMGKSLAVGLMVLIQSLVLGSAAFILGWRPTVIGLMLLIAVLLIGAAVFTALGLLVAGTVRAEATLAITNVVWVLMGAAGGAVVPLHLEGPGALFVLLPSAALGEAARSASIDGAVALIPLGVLAVWFVVILVAAKRWFKWR